MGSDGSADLQISDEKEKKQIMNLSFQNNLKAYYSQKFYFQQIRNEKT